MHREIELKMRVKLRDYGAFEDLLTELGYPVDSMITVCSLNPKAVTRKTAKRKPGTYRKRGKVTPEIRQKVLGYWNTYQSITTGRVTVKAFTAWLDKTYDIQLHRTTVGDLLKGNS